jgi:hypothetical protein
MFRALVTMICVVGVHAVACGPAYGIFHLWKIQEVYSNADGSVQFIELISPNPSSSEHQVNGQQVRSNANNRNFTLVGNLPSPMTSNKTFLIATPGYVALPESVTPDYVFQTPTFFNSLADTVMFLGASPDETFRFDNLASTPQIVSLPTNGFQSLRDPTPFGSDSVTNDLLRELNSPKNFAGATSTIFIPGDTNDNGVVDRTDFARMALNFGKSTLMRHGQGDFNGDRRVDLMDLGIFQSHITPAPGPVIAIPEPSSLALLASSLAGAAAWWRFRTRKPFARGKQPPR